MREGIGCTGAAHGRQDPQSSDACVLALSCLEYGQAHLGTWSSDCLRVPFAAIIKLACAVLGRLTMAAGGW